MEMRNCHRAHKSILKTFVRGLKPPDSVDALKENWITVAKKLKQGNAGHKIPVGSLVDNIRPTGYLDIGILLSDTSIVNTVYSAMVIAERKRKSNSANGTEDKGKRKLLVDYSKLGDALVNASNNSEMEDKGVVVDLFEEVGKWLKARSKHLSKSGLARKTGRGIKKGAKRIGHGLKVGGKWVVKGAAWQIGKEIVKGILD